jgi:predicted aminopeptidase
MIYRFLTILALTTFVAACSGPGYYLQAISGQWKLMHARQDIQLLLSDPATDPELAANLRTADQIKTFAQSSLGLADNGSYSSYVEIDGEALVWNVIATEEFSLIPKKWCFPVAGCVPYRGFFKLQKANDSAATLQNRGLDVVVSPAAAYSSLGWFNDPLLSTMLSGSDVRLAAYLFHELAHQRLYIKDDGMFNEGYASFVEDTGVRLWLESSQRLDELEEWHQLEEVSVDFSELAGQVRGELAELYAGHKTEAFMRQQKAEIFHSFSSAYEQLVSEKWQGKPYYKRWFDEPLNNARLALYNTYEGSHCAFQHLWDQAGANPLEFHRLAEQKSRLAKNQRQEWLKQSCTDIAQRGDL